MRYSYTAQVRPWADTDAKPCRGARAMQSTGKSKNYFYETSTRFPYVINVRIPTTQLLSAGVNVKVKDYSSTSHGGPEGE